MRLFPQERVAEATAVVSRQKPGLLILLLGLLPLILSCGGGGRPKPGREIDMPRFGVKLILSEGWEAEVEGSDWTMWRRVQRGTGEEPWVIPPLTATNVGAGALSAEERVMVWRFKGVKGTFDPNIDPLTGRYPVPPGLWSLDAQKLDLLETTTRALPWPGLQGVEATCRLYENTHGAGATSSIWHTYTIIFNVAPNAYEFVLSIPDTADYREWMGNFWNSIQDLSIQAD